MREADDDVLTGESASRRVASNIVSNTSWDGHVTSHKISRNRNSTTFFSVSIDSRSYIMKLLDGTFDKEKLMTRWQTKHQKVVRKRMDFNYYFLTRF